MRPFRNLKIASVIEAELGTLLVREFDFGNALVTITGVEVGEDLLRAKVKLGIIPYEQGPRVFKEVERRRGELQHKLVKKLRFKPIPHITFSIDQ